MLGLAADSAISNSSGTTIAWTTICTVMDLIEKAAGDGALTWVVTSAAAKILRQRAVVGSAGPAILDGDNRIGGYPCIVIGGTASATAIFGRWQDLIVYQWLPLEIAVNPFASFQQGIIGVRGWASFNAAPLVTGSFATITGIT